MPHNAVTGNGNVLCVNYMWKNIKTTQFCHSGVLFALKTSSAQTYTLLVHKDIRILRFQLDSKQGDGHFTRDLRNTQSPYIYICDVREKYERCQIRIRSRAPSFGNGLIIRRKGTSYNTHITQFCREKKRKKSICLLPAPFLLCIRAKKRESPLGTCRWVRRSVVCI